MSKPSWRPPKRLDKECRALCIAMNKLPGIETFESCCGHGRDPFRIWFRVTDFEARGLLTLAVYTCFRCGPFNFTITLNHTELPENRVTFLLECPAKGSTANATRFAKALTDLIKDRKEDYNILLNRLGTSRK